jgi:hypothetical protein
MTMTCEQAAEFISALCDGEAIRREAAEHMGTCEACHARLEDYVLMGLELKRLASASAPENVRAISRDLVVNQDQKTTPNRRPISRLWRDTMRIPRVAFALMVVVITLLSAGIVVVRATGERQWFKFEAWDKDGKPVAKTTAVFNSGAKIPNSIVAAKVHEGTLGFMVRVLEQNGATEKLGIRAVFSPSSAGEDIRDQLQSTLERQETCQSGEKLSLPVEGYGTIQISGEILDKEPEHAKATLMPKEGDLRLLGRVALLRDDKLVGETESLHLELNAKDMYFAFHPANEGWYIFAPKPFPGAVEGSLNMNQAEFTVDGHKYRFISGAPIRNGSGPDGYGPSNIWVMYTPRYELIPNITKLSEKDPNISADQLDNLLKRMNQ